MLSFHLRATKETRDLIAKEDYSSIDDPKAYKLFIRYFDGIETDYRTVGYLSLREAIELSEMPTRFWFDDDDPLSEYRDMLTGNKAIRNQPSEVQQAWEQFVTIKVLSTR